MNISTALCIHQFKNSTSDKVFKFLGYFPFPFCLCICDVFVTLRYRYRSVWALDHCLLICVLRTAIIFLFLALYLFLHVFPHKCCVATVLDSSGWLNSYFVSSFSDYCVRCCIERCGELIGLVLSDQNPISNSYTWVLCFEMFICIPFVFPFFLSIIVVNFKICIHRCEFR